MECNVLTDRRRFSAARVGGGEAFSGVVVRTGCLDARKLGVLAFAALYGVPAGDEFGQGLWRDAPCSRFILVSD